jgi:hypothetical protein
MARGDDERDRRASEDESRKPRGNALGPREIWRLIAATYRTSFPYLLVFVAGLLLATWLITELVF